MARFCFSRGKRAHSVYISINCFVWSLRRAPDDDPHIRWRRLIASCGPPRPRRLRARSVGLDALRWVWTRRWRFGGRSVRRVRRGCWVQVLRCNGCWGEVEPLFGCERDQLRPSLGGPRGRIRRHLGDRGDQRGHRLFTLMLQTASRHPVAKPLWT